MKFFHAVTMYAFFICPWAISGCEQSDFNASSERTTKSMLQTFVKWNHSEKQRWILSSDSKDVALLMDAEFISSLDTEDMKVINDHVILRRSLERGNGRALVDYDRNYYILLIDIDGDQKVLWKDQMISVPEQVRVLSHDEQQ